MITLNGDAYTFNVLIFSMARSFTFILVFNVFSTVSVDILLFDHKNVIILFTN